MAVTTQELITIADKLVKHTKINKLDNISTLGYQNLRNLFGGDLPEKMRLNSIEQDKSNQQASLLKIKIFVLYNLLQKTKESKYYSQIDNLIRQLNQQPGAAIREERIRFQKLLEDAKKISGKPINQVFLHPQQNQHQYQIPLKREQFHKQEQHDYDSLEQINAKIQDLQKEQDLQKQILLKKYNNLILRRPGSQQYHQYNQFLLASYNKEVEEYENLRKKFEERNKFIEYYKKKYAAKAALSGIQHTQLVMPAQQIAAQQRQALQKAPIAQIKLAEQANQSIENARIAQMRIIAEQAKQAREQQIRITVDPPKEISFTNPIKAPNITGSHKYFTPEQERLIGAYFKENTDTHKIKRSLDRKNKTRTSRVSNEYPIPNLKYSVIKTEKGELFVLTDRILGKGGMSVVKVAESLDNPGKLVAAKIQGSTKHNDSYRRYDRIKNQYGGHIPREEEIRKEESVLSLVQEFLGHTSNRFKCPRGSTIHVYDKQYTLLELKKGQTVERSFFSNNRNITTDQAAQLKIFLKILQATKKLHQLGIIHGDLNFNNFMITDGQINIIDYGMADKANQRGFIINDNISPWVAPEVKLEHGKNYFNSDIYTLGYMMRKMFQYFPTSAPLRTNMEFKKLLDDMTYYNTTNPNSHKSRPSIDECINRMSSILEQEQKKLPQNARGRFGV